MPSKSKITSMPDSLKFSDIVEHARLEKWTAQHVLKHAGLPHLPRAGSQGVHREFSLPQATRFALATQLVMGGVPVKFTARVVSFCEKQVMARMGASLANKTLYESPNNFWLLEIYDNRFVEVVREKDGNINENAIYCLRDNKMVDMLPDVPVPFSTHTIHLSKIERRLIERLSTTD